MGPKGKSTGSTTSLGKRRSLAGRRANSANNSSDQMANLRNEYGSQVSPLRLAASSASEPVKVAVLGAAGGIGQPLSLLLMLHSEYIQHLALYDLAASVRGVALDLSHLDRQCKVTAHLGPDELAEAVRGAKVILVPAGLAQKPGMSRDDLFGSNAKIMYNLARVCAQTAPDASLAIISNPVNSLVPLTCEVYAHVLGQARRPEGDQFWRRIFGVTTLDVIRASSLTARSALFRPEPSGLFKDPAKLSVPVVGGHAGKTIIPVLSQAQPKLDKRRLLEDRATTCALVDSIQQAGIEVLNAKKGTGSATLCMAYAGCRFAIALLRARLGEQNLVECAYVRHQEPVLPDLHYFAMPLQLAKDGGYAKPLGLGKLLPFEQQMVDEASKELRTSIAKGEDFAKEHLSSELSKQQPSSPQQQQQQQKE